MKIHIPNEILGQPGYGLQPFLLDVAVMLYQQERVSLAKAARIAGIQRMAFQEVLAERKIPISYDLEGDLVALEKWRN
jgi:predicted HTH domain antitoxin